MGDRSYLQITIYDCHTRRRKVADLLAEYVGLEYGDTPPEVAVGKQYVAQEIYLGSMRELAARLIDLAPGCSFRGWQDPYEQYLGEHVAYCPRWGRFDGDCTGGGDVVLGHQEVTGAADHRGYLARDTMLRLHAGDMSPEQLAAWQARPGLAEAIEVAYGVPWHQHAKGIKPPKSKARAWAAIIDRQHKQVAEARHAHLGTLASRAQKLGLARHVQALQDATDPATAPGTARGAADACAVALEAVAAGALLTLSPGQESARIVQQALGSLAYLPVQLRSWAEGAEEAHAGRRRP
jgi:hypothetical protein